MTGCQTWEMEAFYEGALNTKDMVIEITKAL
jgi:hypothetical protein